MRARHRHFTIANSGALACWDSRPLTQSDNTSITAWSDRIAALSADRASNAPVVRTAIQGGQPIVRFGAGTFCLETASNNLTRNKGRITMVSVAASTAANSANYQTVVRSRAGASNDRCSIYLRQNKVEAGGRRLDANSYQFVQSGTTSNDVFYVASGLWDYANAALTAYESGTATSRSGGFQTSGSTSDTASNIEIGGVVTIDQRLLGDVGLVAFVETNSPSLRRRFEHAAAFSFKISCN
jgi:hypothetical protein